MPAPSIHRAYSLLTIKHVDEPSRVITGLATTPTPDRSGDVVVPAGARFRLPIPLLLFHDSHMPIGEVFAATVTDAGIEIQARLVKTDVAGALKDRLDLAWQSISLGLVKGLSIGFKSVKETFDKAIGGYRYQEWEWLELSAVTIPANADASILAIKAADVFHEAPRLALPVVTLTRPGVSGVSSKGPTQMAKTFTERVQAFTAEKAAKIAKLTDIIGADEGSTLDAAQQETFDALTQEIKAIDGQLSRLETAETLMKQTAVPVTGATAADATQARSGSVITVKDNLPPGMEFARYAMCLAAARGNTHQALEIAKARYPDLSRVHTVLKSAVEAGTTTDPHWAGALVPYQQYAGDFIEFLRPATIIGKFGANGIPGFRRIPFNVSIKGQTSGGTGYWVGEARGKPLTKFDFNTTTLRWAKVANIAVISEELARFSSPSAEMLVRDALAAALIERLDVDFVDPWKQPVADVSPASISYGVTATASSGTDAASVRADIQSIMGKFIANNITPSSGVWIMLATTALALSLMRNALGQREFPDITMLGGRFEGLPVVVSEYCAIPSSPSNHIVILVNASDVYLADDGQVVIDASREASLEMSDAPTQVGGGSGSPAEAVMASSVLSLWQTNSIGLRAERFINWAKRRAGACEYLDGVNWSATGSPV